MRQVFSSIKGVRIKDVPAPYIQRGHLIVEVDYSMVGAVAEIAVTQDIQEHTDHAIDEIRSRKGEDKYKKRGIFAILNNDDEIISAVAQDKPLGYGCSGRVVEVGDGVTGFRVGDRVACAGAEFAGHSELVIVPSSLVARIPEKCETMLASSVSAGATAMNALRRSDIKLGEIAVVCGLGMIGLIQASLLKSAGAKVYGFDNSLEKRQRANLLGLEDVSSFDNAASVIGCATSDKGVDCTFITAPAHNEDAFKIAAEITRKRGKIILVGMTKTKIAKEAILSKEIDILASCSFGPGRHEKSYEKMGLEYPYPYVRWTEQRNIEEYLHLLATGKIMLEKICDQVFPLEEAEHAFSLLSQEKNAPCGVFLSYGNGRTLEQKISRRLVINESLGNEGKVKIALVGPGKIATKAHLPSIAKIDNAELLAVVGRNGGNTTIIAQEYGAKISATSYDDIVNDEEIDAFVITTRNNLHADMVVKALRAGKHVFVEKPLALSIQEMKAIEFFYAKKEFDGSKMPILMTGFNRRFSKPMQKVYEICSNRIGPMVINYQMNAGYMDTDHWMRGLEGGGRNLGDACQVYDIFTFLTDAIVSGITVNTMTNIGDVFDENENFCVSFNFEDGSIANLVYTNLGNGDYPRELMTVFVDENIITINDYKSVECFGSLAFSEKYSNEEKGYFEEMEAFVEAIADKGSLAPIPLWQQIQATRMAVAVETKMSKPIMGLDYLLGADADKQKNQDLNAKARERLQSLLTEGRLASLKQDDNDIPAGDIEEKA